MADHLVNSGVSRRLAAILAADTAGYSAFVGADEGRTVRYLKAHQAVVLPMNSEHAGRVIDTAGDSIRRVRGCHPEDHGKAQRNGGSGAMHAIPDGPQPWRQGLR